MKKVIKEDGVVSDTPANAAGSGGVEGIGIGSKGEPGVDRRKRKLRDIVMATVSRGKP
jgi:hypothetical protein